jgi:hypothetical protein
LIGTRKGSEVRYFCTIARINRTFDLFADDLNTYFYFGLQVANVIAIEHHVAAREAGVLIFHK